MNLQYRFSPKLVLFLFPPFLLMSCAAGDAQFAAESPAGFVYGLWHGIISFITLIIHLFNDAVMVYEKNNTGGWYDFGFLIGVAGVWGGGCHLKCKSAEQKNRDKEWEEIGEKVEIKVMRKLKNWAEDDIDDKASEDVSQNVNDEVKNKDNWDDVCDKVEKKLKRKIREWADKE